MLLTITCLDKPGALDLRLKTRPSHLAWVKQTLPANPVFLGPLLGPDGTTPIGSMFIAEFDSIDAARAWQQNDPYQLAGVFGTVTVTPCRNLVTDYVPAR